MTENFKDMVILLTGATGHLGKPMFQCFAQNGATVIATSRSQSKLNALKELAENPEKIYTYQIDLLNTSEIQRLCSYIQKTFKKLNLIVNNAHQGRASSWEEATDEDFIRDYKSSVIAPFNLIKGLHALLKKTSLDLSETVSIINIASMYGLVSPDARIYGDSGMNNPPHYGASKAGLIQLTKYFACHLASDRIRVNSVSPGPFPAAAVSDMHPSFIAELNKKVPLARTGVPEEVVQVVAFLASLGASYVNGANIPVDGGWTAW